MQDLVSRLAEDSVKLRPPASAQQLVEFEETLGSALERSYRDFLSVSDGLDGFYVDMVILGCRDWPDSPELKVAQSFLDMVLDVEMLEDEDLPSSTKLVPVAVNSDATHGIFMIDTQGAVAERYWWTGNGSSMLFRDLNEVFAYVIDPREYLSR
ncbi:SMI1/KNR4 family protein [Streptomyces sp. NPDC037389]|uniref:SMI1/KNR4 family protein n=1 Tax=Streptomyces sp. NPDC037389 TaxID=3155369 RepID=UPI003402C4F2